MNIILFLFTVSFYATAMENSEHKRLENAFSSSQSIIPNFESILEKRLNRLMNELSNPQEYEQTLENVVISFDEKQLLSDDLIIKIEEELPHANPLILHQAVKTRNILLVGALLNAGCKINQQNSMGHTPLHEAVFLTPPHPIMVGQILAHKPKINKSDDRANSALHYAVSKNGEIVRLLLQAHADSNAKNIFGQTPLHIAIFKATAPGADIRRSLSMIKNLMCHGADANAKTNNGYTICHDLLSNTNVDPLPFIKYIAKNSILDLRSKTSFSSSTPLHNAVEKWADHTELLQFLMGHHNVLLNVNNTELFYNTALHTWIKKEQKNDTEILNLFLKRSFPKTFFVRNHQNRNLIDLILDVQTFSFLPIVLKHIQSKGLLCSELFKNINIAKISFFSDTPGILHIKKLLAYYKMYTLDPKTRAQEIKELEQITQLTEKELIEYGNQHA